MRDRRRVLLSLLVVACVAGMTIYVARLQGKIDGQQKVIKHEQDTVAQQQKAIGFEYRFIIESCIRLNILRAEDNVSHFADYKIFRVVYIQERSQSSLTERLFGRRVAMEVAKSQKTLQVQVRSAVFTKSWTPLTNCREAVNKRGLAYRPPNPIPFVKQLPPRYDLYPQPHSVYLEVP